MRGLIFLFFALLANSTHAQNKPISNDLAYPDLIPTLINGKLYGYCDKELNIKIKPNFDKAGLFEEDFNFQRLHVHNPEITKFGTAAYAWVIVNGERYRIDKNGNRVYKYNASDFKKGETIIHLYRNSTGYQIEKIDEKSLFQEIKDIHTGKIVFPNEQSIHEFRVNNQELVQEGVKLVFYPSFIKIPFTDYTSETTFLKGIKNSDTDRIIIKAKYATVEGLYNNSLRTQQYALFIAYRGDLDKEIYVGLNGIEYNIQE